MKGSKRSPEIEQTHGSNAKLDEILRKGRPVLPPMANQTSTQAKEAIETATTIKYISNSAPIEVSPPEIIINDIEPNQTYEVVVYVRNLTNIGRRIRVYQPKTNKFRCDYDMQGNVAAGLAMKLVLSFETDKAGDFHDQLEIVSDNGFSLTVPLHAYQPQANVAFDPFINFGFIRIQKEEVRPILFENQGKKEGRVDLKFDGSNELAIVPNSFVIKQGERREVLLKYTPKEAGIFRGTIEVSVEGQSLLKNIDVSATSVDYFIFMVDKHGAQSQNFDFGDIYFGQFKEIEGYLVNNSPQKFNFKAKFLTGLQNNAGDLFSLQTPFDLGQEQIQRIMTCSPAEGVIDSYSQVPIKFSCKSRVSEDMIFWTSNYCMRKERHDDEEKSHNDFTLESRFEPTNYSYTCIFEFDGKNDMSPYIHLSAKGICPTVKISHHLINFGECKVHDRRDYMVTLENRNDDHAVEFNFANVAHFKVNPKIAKLQPSTSQKLVFSFEPKSLGKFSTFMDLELFNIYKIPIKVMGTSLSLSEKKFLKRGPESVPEDFTPNRNFIVDDNIDYASKKVRKGDRLIFSSTGNLAELEGTNVSDKLNLYYTQKTNKDKYNTYLKDSRTKRLDKPKELLKNKKFDLTADRLEDLVPNREFFMNKDKEDGKIVHPFDFDFIFGTENIPMDRPKYALPDPHDPLYVTKPLGHYEPGNANKIDIFKPDPNKVYKKMFPPEPSCQAELRDVLKELNAEELQKIFVGPTTIDFGIVYIKSRVSKYFAVKNQLKTAISVQLTCNHSELGESYQKVQIIPPMQTAGFEIVFSSHNLQMFRGSIKYTINGKHEFFFAVNAQVEPVKLVLESNQMIFKFQEKDEDMEITQKLTINNKGNAPGNFRWEVPQNSIFKVSPVSGTVPAEGNFKVYITYMPSGVNFKGESERLGMMVENGEAQYLNCIGYVNEAKCEFREAVVDFGNVLVSQEQPKGVILKNKHKTTAVFRVNSVPRGITVFPLTGRIPPDNHTELRVSVLSKEEISIADDILVNIRGGKPVRLPVKASVIIPQVRIVEEEFDFGGVTYGSSATLPMTLVNDSGISAMLRVNLTDEREYPGIQFLEILPAQEPGDDESSFIVSVAHNENSAEGEPDEDASLSMSDSDDEEEEKETMRNFNIKIKENGTLNFLLKFTPNDAKAYNFELPITLQGDRRIEGLNRFISCRGLRPRCIIDPPFLEFNKKTITSFEKPLPDTEKIVLTNMDHTRPITWKLDTKGIDEDRAFTISPTQGRIEPGQQQTLSVGFSPLHPGQYEKVVHLFLDKEQTKPYSSITLKGLGGFPKLLFDRREIILPVVPLDIESRCTFKIINDGYENLTLKYEIANDIGNIGKDFLKLEFPEGKNLGVTKPKLRVDAVFKAKKPLSFTVELNFIDDNKHVYRIKISGTTDNSLFTNFPYLQRNFGEFEMTAAEKAPLTLKEFDDESSEEAGSPKAFSIGVSKSGGSTTSRAGKGLLGYSPIPQKELEKGGEFIKNWLNQNVVSVYISKFPLDLIENDGTLIYDLVQFLTGKSPAGKASLTMVTKKTEKIKVMHKQYDDLIRVLKENGALLNTIRPEFLFRHTDYNTYVKVQDNQYLSPNMIKLSESKFNYLSADAWTTLFYQILKVYFLGKLTVKNFKNTPGMPPERLAIPEYYLDGSNVVGVSENLLLRWLEVHYEKVKNIAKRLRNFGEDLRDGHVFAAVIQSYVGNNASKSLSQMRNNTINKEDYLFNAGKIINALEELGLQTPFTAKDLENPSQREVILFCLYLYNNLPHYIPKATIEFACMLRDSAIKYIELSNPAHKAISYRVHLEGDADFSLEGLEERDTHIHLEPKTSLKFPIKYVARLSKPVTGRIMFTNKREEGNIQAAALVFDLKSKVTGRRSEGTENFQTRLYEMKTKDLKVENLFNMKADFQVELIYQKPVPVDDGKKKRSVVPASKSKTPAKAETKPDDFFMPFGTRITTLTVPRLGSATIPITFLPFTMESHTCHIVFRDDKVGEIQYTLVGEVDLPPPVEVPTAGVFYMESDMRFQAAINVQNHILQNARKLHIDRLPQGQKAREQEKEKQLRLYERSFETVTFDVEPLSTYLNLPTNFTIVQNAGKNAKTDAKDKSALKKKNETSFDSKLSENLATSLVASTMENRLNIGLNFRTPTKDQPLRFIFRSQNKVDIRVYEIKVTVLPKPIKAILEMKCPARETLTQDIPIRNDTDKDWGIKAQLVTDTGRNGNFFSGGKDFRVAKNSTGYYTLQFKPTWITTAEAKLILSNPHNGQQYDFDLKGVGEEPLAEGHVVLDCKARKTKSHIFRIKNEYDRKMAYRVETDLFNASGKSNFELIPGKTEDYVMDVTPLLGGAYTGSITFFDEMGRYKWWTVEVHTESAKAEKTIDLSTIIRKAIAFDISLSNPLDKTVTFEVLIKGEGLFGENAFTLHPKQTGVYELIFSPLKPMTGTGSIAFIHEELGEIWYELNLHSEEPQSVRLTTLKAELGKCEYHEVELENPSFKEVHVRPKLSNPHNFDIMPEDIIIPPYDSIIAQIRYMPSDLDVVESCEVVFETDEIGKWSYLAFGQGIPPTKFDVQTISGSLNRDSSSMINFKNPFKDPIAVSITLETSEENKKVFDILLKKTKLVIGGLNVIQIPISFLPRAINDYTAEVVITMNEKISWRYPLKGITESYSTANDFYLKTKCRVRHETELKIHLPGNMNVSGEDHYTLELINIPKEYEKILQNSNHKAIVFSPVRDTLTNAGDPLVFKAIFQPLKPFKTSLDIAIVKSTGGRWKYKLFLESTLPDPDDTITITSTINKTSSVSFKLTNYTKHGAEFTSNFTAESDSEFTIFPKTGILEPYGKEREGTNFVISFTPNEYGKIKTGKLIIQTEEMFWSYNVRGIFPKYVVPKINGTRIQHRLSDDVAKKLSSGKVSRNFLVENIRKSSHSPPPKGRTNRPHSGSRSRSQSRSRSRSPQKEQNKEAYVSPSINVLTPK